jgi:hypothetical protein
MQYPGGFPAADQPAGDHPAGSFRSTGNVQQHPVISTTFTPQHAVTAAASCRPYNQK